MKLWDPSPDRISRAQVTTFIKGVNQKFKLKLKSFSELYDWSVQAPQDFWQALWDFVSPQVGAAPNGAFRKLAQPHPVHEVEWFPGARLNFTENLLVRRDDHPALVFCGEGVCERTFSFREVATLTGQLQRSLSTDGVVSGDRVAAFLPNLPETVIAMLGTASLGAVWSSCSPDFGVEGVVDRFGQIEPKVLFVCDGYLHKGKWIDTLSKARDILSRIPSVKRVVVVPYDGEKVKGDLNSLPSSVSWDNYLSEENGDAPQFVQTAFNHPLYILYSSGTTGKPKCIVHGVGGTLLEHLKEHRLHTDLTSDDRFFYQTTCGWMMWNWLVTGLASGATLILYDGAPFHRGGKILLDLIQREKITIFGTNAKYLAALEKEKIKPNQTHDLSLLHTILSTGSPLLPESYDYVYRDLKKDVCLSSISGGTDIIGCFALGCPTLPVHRGELQCRSLGIKVEVFDDSAKPVTGEKGELVCTAPFPSMPVSFWNDPKYEKYYGAYFARFSKRDGKRIWHHGDYVEITQRGTMIFYGRSDAVLNPGGIRIGTAEIYNQVEKIPEILESVVVGQDCTGDVQIVLFVRLQDGVTLDEKLSEKIRAQIRKNTTAFHVPKKIIQVPDIPRTRSGKIVELAIRDVMHGRPVKNIEALANPEALEHFRPASKKANTD